MCGFSHARVVNARTLFLFGTLLRTEVRERAGADQLTHMTIVCAFKHVGPAKSVSTRLNARLCIDDQPRPDMPWLCCVSLNGPVMIDWPGSVSGGVLHGRSRLRAILIPQSVCVVSTSRPGEVLGSDERDYSIGRRPSE